MTTVQLAAVAIVVVTIGLFLWGRWRHDVVGIAALLACVFAGLVPASDAFAGFGHPAVVTVAGVLALSRMLQTSGAVDILAQRLLPRNAGPGIAVAALMALAAVLSAFMNNVGALALLMPVGLQLAARQGIAPARVLMPLAFGSILGGMTTLIGTPPNLIVSGFRAEAGGSTFSMFDFAPVGVPVALGGMIFVALTARWLVPARAGAGGEAFEIDKYVTEVRVDEDAPAVGRTLREVERDLDESDAFLLGVIRNDVRLAGFSPRQRVQAGDILVVEADPGALAGALSSLGLSLEEDKRDAIAEREEGASGDEGAEEETSNGDGDLTLLEMVVLPASSLTGRSVADIQLRTRYGINMLAVSRQGERSRARLRTLPLRPGDVLLMQGLPERLTSFAAQAGCVPLAERAINLPGPRDAILAAAIMGAAVVAAAFGLAPAAVAFVAGALAATVTGLLPVRTLYGAIDWSVIVLLGAMIPVAGAMASTGAADVLARLLIDHLAQGNVVVALALILVVTMTLSDFMNNAATAAVMCPIALGTAEMLGARPEAFLMAVAVGASCAFLTPVGHQNNTLILGPAGLRFGDYWRLGLPLEIVVVLVAVPMILIAWAP